ncbi:MAG TPA: hypothetical protein VJ891_07245 [Casimicrobiaceae bacterium]|nr:hypothetical protein [Casimicrobiaceae bacterium]
MKHRAWLFGLVVVASAAGAQDIHKCVGDTGVVAYQNVPCSRGQVDAGLLKLPDYADPAKRDGASAPPLDDVAAPASAAPSPATPFPSTQDAQNAFPFRTTIRLGMTDDQVLNMPGWGVPTRIVRNGRHRGWREEWTYEAGDQYRQLSFVNGRLESIGREMGPYAAWSDASMS